MIPSTGLFAMIVCILISVSFQQEKTTSTTEDTSQKLLVLPDPEKCANRDEEAHKEDKENWLLDRNFCREYCMDLVSIETPTENDMITKFILDNEIPYIWTSGRKCNFKGCDREDLLPSNINGWFWSGSGIKLAPTNKIPPGWPKQPWSHTGHKTQFEGRNVSQPDNAEYDINKSDEACLGVLNDIYQDGIVWHDIACYHSKPYICEDSDQLLDYVRRTNPKLKIE